MGGGARGDLSGRRVVCFMNAMLATAPRSFVFSALLHAAVAGLLLMAMREMRRETNAEPHTVVMVPDTWFAPVVTREVSAQLRTNPAVAFAMPERVATSVPERQDAPVVRPETPANARTSATSRRPVSRPTTIAEHRRLNPSRTEAGRADVVTPPRIDVNEVLGGGPTTTANPERPARSVDGAAVKAYLAQLIARLRAAHDKPDGLNDGLQARVEFLLRADGAVVDVRILQSSGSEAFDASVLAAFRRLSALGAPPEGVAGVRQITFRTQGE